VRIEYVVIALCLAFLLWKFNPFSIKFLVIKGHPEVNSDLRPQDIYTLEHQIICGQCGNVCEEFTRKTILPYTVSLALDFFKNDDSVTIFDCQKCGNKFTMIVKESKTCDTK
jgi:predicted molibdopterin-dependent oxidoreductase YjgC